MKGEAEENRKEPKPKERKWSKSRIRELRCISFQDSVIERPFDQLWRATSDPLADRNFVPFPLMAFGVVMEPELPGLLLRLVMELLVSRVALFSVLTLAACDVLLHDDVVLAADAAAPELQQNIQPVLLQDMLASLCFIARNDVLQLPLFDPNGHCQLLELPGQLQGRDLPRQQQRPPQGRQLLQQGGYRCQVCLVLGVHILLEPCFHAIT